MSNDVNDFLFGGGAKAFQFENLNDICHGTVVGKPEIRQQTSLEGEPLTWGDGSPRKMLVIVVQTDEVTEDDDGQRALYAKGGRFEIAQGEGLSMRDAIADAMKAVKAVDIGDGDELWVGYTGIGKAKKGMSPPKLYSARFRKAQQTLKAADIFGPEPTPLDTGV